jgi:Ca-activated chloride channel family protein
LLNQIRLDGPDQETIDQIVRLSIRYGIVTPYTSYLVTEDLPLGAAEQERIAEEQLGQMLAQPSAPVSGQEAVQKAADQGSLAGAEAPAAPPQEESSRVRVVGARTYVFQGGQWIDTAFDPERMETVKVSFLSDDFFALAASRHELASAFALGEAVIALAGGVAYEVVPPSADLPPVDLPPTRTPGPDAPLDAPVSTPTPVSDTDVDTPPQPAQTAPCAGGLIPLAMVSITALSLRKRRRQI